MSDPRDTPCRRLARLTFTVLMATAWCGAVPHLTNPAAAQPADEAPVDPKAVVALVKRLCATAEQELRKPGADPSDVPAKAAELDFDAGRIFAFVRDEVAYEPYRGVLRGARGALSARAANSLDKSLLLKQLLEAGGHEARLMRGRLPDEKARALVDQFLARPPAPSPAGAGAGDGDVQIPPALADQLGVALPDLKQVLDDNRRDADKLLADGTAAADVEATFLRQQLDAAGVKLGRTHAQWLHELASRAADHVWVELVGADGSTTVLDPSFAPRAGDAEPVAAATEGRPVADLNAERHLVRFQFVYTATRGGTPEEQVLIDLPLYADEALYEPPMFSIEPADPLPPPSKMLQMEPKELIKLLTGFKNYQAVLSVGGRRTASSAFDLKGNVMPVSADGRIKGAQQLGAAAGGLFGGGALGGGGEEKQEANHFVEMGVVLTTRSPGAPPAPQRRVLLTRAQTTGDEFLSPILEWKMLLQPQPLNPTLVGHEALKSTLHVLAPILPALDNLNDGNGILDRMARTRPSTYPELLMNLAGFRQAMTSALLRENPPVAALWDRPQVAISEQRFCANAKEVRTCSHATIDLVDNTLSFVPRSPEAAEAAARCAVRQGVFDTTAEALMLQRQSAVPGAAGAGAIDDLRAAREAGGGLKVVPPHEAGSLASTGLSEADRRWIAAYEPVTRRVAARPAGGGGASAWWSVDPQTGCVLGRRDGGRGQAMHEYVVQVAVGGICMIVNAINTSRDMAASGGKRRTLGPGYYLAQLGCIVGAGFGVAGVGRAAGMQSVLTLINGLIGAAFSIAGAEIAR